MRISKQNVGLGAKGLSKSYGDTTALRNLNFKVGSGDVYCFLGQYGAGKTTTINIFLGRIEATSGEALVNGSPVVNTEVALKEIAYLPELVQLYGKLSGTENLDLFSRLAGQIPTDSAAQEFQEIYLQNNLIKTNYE